MRRSIENFYQSCFEFFVDHPWVTIFATVSLMLLASFGASRIHFSVDYRYFFSDQNPNLQAMNEIDAVYSSPDSIIWMVQPQEGHVTDPRIVNLLAQMAEDAWQVPYVNRVDAITNYQHIEARGDDLYVGELFEDVYEVTDEEAAIAHKILTTDSPLVRQLISADGRTTGVVATVQVPEDNEEALSNTVAAARALTEKYSAEYPDVKILTSGVTAMSYAYSEVAQESLSNLTPIMIAMIFLVCLILMRSIYAIGLTLIVIVLSTTAAFGMAGWLGITLTSPSSMASPIILTIAVADSIHVLTTMLVNMHNGMEKRAALLDAMRVNVEPVILTSLTTAIGFLCLNFSDSPPFWDLGNIAAMGSIAALFLSLTLLPALASVLPLKPSATIARQGRAFGWVARTSINNRVTVVIASLLIVVGSGFLTANLTLDDRMDNQLDESVPVRQANDFAIKHLASMFQFHYSIPAQGSSGITEVEYLENLDKFTSWYFSQPEIEHVTSVVDIFKRLNRAMHGGDDAFYKVPDDPALAAQLLLLYEMSLPYGLDLNSQINVDKSATRVTVTFPPLSTAEITGLRDRADAWMKANLPDYMQAEAAGHTLMFAFIGTHNVRGMVVGTAAAIIAISLILMVALRSVKLGLMSVIPNIAPPFIAFGVYALISTSAGFWAAFVTATALGLIVDATVHFLSKYQRARTEQGKDPEQAIHYAFSTVGTALWVCSAMLVVGFGILGFANFEVIKMLGVMVAGTVAIALVFDFLLLPALLMLVDRAPAKKPVPQSV